MKTSLFVAGTIVFAAGCVVILHSLNGTALVGVLLLIWSDNLMRTAGRVR